MKKAVRLRLKLNWLRTMVVACKNKFVIIFTIDTTGPPQFERAAVLSEASDYTTVGTGGLYT